jgi:LL-diaminopimelate aminotransferase
MTEPRLPQRLSTLPPYPFAEIDRKKRQAMDQGVDVVDLGVGDPDLPTPPHIVQALCAAAPLPEHHQYPSYLGSLAFREAAVRYMKRRFGVALDAQSEALALIGSKEGIAHLALALLDPGDTVLVPDPAYPVCAISAQFVGAEVVPMPLTRDQGFRPRLADIDTRDAQRAKVMWLNYPNNPTGGVASRDYWQDVGAFAVEYDLLVASDAAYAEIYLDDTPPVSALEVVALRDRAIEFHSLSKTFNMTGWRVGFAVGTAWMVQALGTVKTNVDSGIFGAVQQAAIAALDGPTEPVAELRTIYRRRRERLVAGLRQAGLDVVDTTATFYVVAAVPNGETALSYTGKLLDDYGIVCMPCTAFGPGGEGYVRFSLTADDERIDTAARRLT